MRRPALAVIAATLMALASGAPQADPSAKIRNFIDKSFNGSPSTGQFNCAYQGKRASKPCAVTIKKERIDHPDFVAYIGKPDTTEVITIRWPDGDQSKYTWLDDGGMLNLGEKKAFGYQVSGTEEETDWSRGFVINKNGSEYVRLW